MKKFIAIVLVLVTLFAMTACGAKKTADVPEWQKSLFNQGKLTVGMCNDYPPYESLNAKGELVGFDVELAKKLAEAMGLELDIKQYGFYEVITATQLGEVDLGISAFAYKEDRDVLFSDPYISNTSVIAVRKDSGLKTFEDLAGKTIAAGTGTSCEAAAKEAIPTANYVAPGDYVQMFAALDNGAVDAVACAGTVAQSFVDNNDALVILEKDLGTEETHVIAKKGNDALMKAVNEALAKVMADPSYKELMSSFGVGE